MPAFALDSDAFVFLHALGLLDRVGQQAAEGRLTLHLTGTPAYIELNSLQDRVKQLEGSGALRVHKLRRGTESFSRFRELVDKGRTRSGKPVHKGECEMVAWLSTDGEGITFVSCDTGARELAREHRIEVFDLCDFVCELVRLGLLAREVATEHVAVWDDPHAGRGRPGDFPGFETALARWLARQPGVPP